MTDGFHVREFSNAFEWVVPQVRCPACGALLHQPPGDYLLRLNGALTAALAADSTLWAEALAIECGACSEWCFTVVARIARAWVDDEVSPPFDPENNVRVFVLQQVSIPNAARTVYVAEVRMRRYNQDWRVYQYTVAFTPLGDQTLKEAGTRMLQTRMMPLIEKTADISLARASQLPAAQAAPQTTRSRTNLRVVPKA